MLLREKLIHSWGNLLSGQRKFQFSNLLSSHVNVTVENSSQRLLQTLAIYSAVIAFTETIALYAFDDYRYPIFAAIVLVVSMVCYVVVSKGELRIPFWVLFLLIGASVFLGINLYGWSSGVFYFLFDLLPLIFFMPILKPWEKGISLVMICGLMIILLVPDFHRTPLITLEPTRLQLLNVVNAVLAFSAFSILLRICYWNMTKTAQALINVNDELKRMSERDPLTNLLNRRSLLKLVNDDRQKELIKETRTAIIMADIDNYKAVNDTYGHLAGDAILVQLSAVLNENIRKQDLVIRWGGEEFLIYLPGLDMEALESVIQRLRSSLREKVFHAGEKEISISMTYGGVICSADETIETGIRRADRAMYFGKEQGRDQAIIEDEGKYISIPWADPLA